MFFLCEHCNFKDVVGTDEVLSETSPYARGISCPDCFKDRWSLMRTYDPQERAREKARSRAADAAALAEGTKTREELCRENASFAFPRALVRLTYRGRKF